MDFTDIRLDCHIYNVKDEVLDELKRIEHRIKDRMAFIRYDSEKTQEIEQLKDDLIQCLSVYKELKGKE